MPRDRFVPGWRRCRRDGRRDRLASVASRCLTARLARPRLYHRTLSCRASTHHSWPRDDLAIERRWQGGRRGASDPQRLPSPCRQGAPCHPPKLPSQGRYAAGGMTDIGSPRTHRSSDRSGAARVTALPDPPIARVMPEVPDRAIRVARDGYAPTGAVAL